MFEINSHKLPVFYQNLKTEPLAENDNKNNTENRVIVVNNNEFEKDYYGAFSSEKNVLYKPISRILTYE
jgi:hypothetical protein